MKEYFQKLYRYNEWANRRVLGAIYIRTFKVWLEDDTPDMARTLAELDRRLQQAEEIARWTRGFGRSRPTTTPPAPAAA